MPAFEGAVLLGFRYVETDVHVTSDGVLLAFHDDVLDRVTDRSGIIAELPWSEVQKAKVSGREPIPLLEDLLGSFPDLRVNIDPKHDAAVAPLIDVIEKTSALRPRVHRVVLRQPGVDDAQGLGPHALHGARSERCASVGGRGLRPARRSLHEPVRASAGEAGIGHDRQ